MKKLKRISLTNLSKEKLNKREQNQVLGGDDCCACYCGGNAAIAEMNNGAQVGTDMGNYSLGTIRL